MEESESTLYRTLQRNAEEHGSEPALIAVHETLSHQQLLDRVDQLSTGLNQRGLSLGDRVCILAENSVDYFALYGACARSGAIAFPINWRLSPQEVQQVLILADPKALVVDSANMSKLEEIDLPEIPIRGMVGEETTSRFVRLSEIASSPADQPAEVTAQDPFLILTTAAVEGVPRGALLTHSNLQTAGEQLISALGLSTNDRHLTALPLFHITSLGLSLATLQTGGANVVLERFDPGLAVQLMDQHRVSLVAVFPPVLSTLLDAREAAQANWESLKYVLGLDAPDVIQRLNSETQADFWTGFGQSETSGVVTLTSVREKPGSAGKPLPAAQVSIRDEKGAQMPAGVPGEIAIQGPLVFQGYWRDPDMTAYVSRHGWHHTGDVGRIDEDGYLYYLGRKPEKDLIKSGGENVYPAEVEFTISSLPQVEAVCVIGVPDETWGETVKAVVELKSGESLTSDEVSEAVARQIAAYKKPRVVEFVESLPRTDQGQIDREAVKKSFG